jgi:hypothetical protein
MVGKKIAFWLGVAGVAVLANFGVELLSDHVQIPGLQELVAYTHRGPGR